nr:T9SS type A sorting domain-containing protein [Flavobacteriales bacterium]
IPQVEFSDSVITDTINWIKINGSFIATGNEKYLVLGNFNRKQTTTAIQVGNMNINYSYYYIDNVCVSADSLTCNQPVGVNEIEPQSLFEIFPNPVTNYFTINYKKLNDPYDLTIYNTFGQKIYEEKDIFTDRKTINTTAFNKGLLLINIKSKNQSINYKLLKP